ncbi:unnamed protein product [Cyclocybe aegerita]|uniref:Uncharacterized protein n=1 Tax=Cyclocybe aegerita TaxID=1973307 RepID=A0A8S0X7C7_CYCAE|nr:unnamed protein product [Cyclocybe aegerita]
MGTTSRGPSIGSTNPDDSDRFTHLTPSGYPGFVGSNWFDNYRDNIRTLLRSFIAPYTSFIDRRIQAAQLLSPGTASTVPDFPNEILLHCFTFMTLESLIASRCVGTVINTSYFLETRPSRPDIRPRGVHCCLGCTSVDVHVPPAFRLLVLESPALAVIVPLPRASVPRLSQIERVQLGYPRVAFVSAVLL